MKQSGATARQTHENGLWWIIWFSAGRECGWGAFVPQQGVQALAPGGVRWLRNIGEETATPLRLLGAWLLLALRLAGAGLFVFLRRCHSACRCGRWRWVLRRLVGRVATALQGLVNVAGLKASEQGLQVAERVLDDAADVLDVRRRGRRVAGQPLAESARADPVLRGVGVLVDARASPFSRDSGAVFVGVGSEVAHTA